MSLTDAVSTKVDPTMPLRLRLDAATQAAFGPAHAGVDPMIHRSQHADFQADLAMALARGMKRNPREVATAIAERLTADDVIAKAEVSGPGFINLTLQTSFLNQELGRMLNDDRLGVPVASPPETVVLDYSAPNVAKEMHVGHLRSTVIGDAIARLLEFQGQKVIRQNHIGDWGTPFGMLIEHLIDQQSEGENASVTELGSFYKAARAKFDADEAFAERARQRVVRLQSGDAETLSWWRRLMEISVAYFSHIYERLDVTLRPEHVAGESSYNAALLAVVQELQDKGLAQLSEGAMCVFLEGFQGRDDAPVPLIIRKSDGGYSYATTDLAALKHRVQSLGATRVIVVVGATQAQHLAMVFATARAAGWVDDAVRLEHVGFGSVLGPDKKMFKTRAGESITLLSLIDEAAARAQKVVEAKAPDFSPEDQARIAKAVGIGAIKYVDLSNDRVKDYVFDWNRMLAFEGNTAPYIMYAHARIRSILRKAAGEGVAPPSAQALRVETPEERALALSLLQFSSIIEKTADTLQPHRICVYLHEVATGFSGFYEKCPVMKSEGTVRDARVALCELTARLLCHGLSLLGIGSPEPM